MAAREQLDQQAVHPVYVIVWDNVNFHCAVPIRVVHKQPGLHFFPPCNPLPESNTGVFLCMEVEGL